MLSKKSFVALVTTVAVIMPVSTFSTTGANAALQTNGEWVMPNGHLNITVEDLKYMLDQIKIGEAVAARTAAGAPASNLAPGAASTGVTLAGAAGTKAPTASIVYPFDITTKDRCMQAVDVANAALPGFSNATVKIGLSNVYPYSNLESYGTRTVDGSCNNITNVAAANTPGDTAAWGASDQLFVRSAKRAIAANYPGASGPTALTPTQAIYSDPTKIIVVDPAPRRISNLISDQSTDNPAAVEAATQAQGILYGKSTAVTENSVNATTGAVNQVLQIPNITPDYNVSAGFNSWFTLFGQFFDHGLDLIPKAGASVYIPLDQSDPLYRQSPGSPNYMVLTRGADPVTGESVNTTTPYVDQSQSYGSHASQNFFIREYNLPAIGGPVPTGRLIDGSDAPHTALLDGTLMPSSWVIGTSVDTAQTGTITKLTGGLDTSNRALAQWIDIKAQARLLGIQLTDFDVNSIPIIATDQYGNFIPNPVGGYPMMLMQDTTTNDYQWQSGSPNAPLATNGNGFKAVSSGHAFLNDMMAIAVPFDRTGANLAPDADSVMNSPTALMATGTYDDESLDSHYITGDGRANENIGLSSIHSVFHAEHNTVAGDIEAMLTDGTAPGLTPDFIAEWKNAAGSDFNGTRIYQAARIVTENEYQHMVFDEFIRRIVPSLPLFAAYDPTANAAITAEFASAVYRVGHSMLNETIARSNPGEFYDPTNNQDVSLITGFTNPPQARLQRPMVIATASFSGGTATYTMQSGETAPKTGSVVTIQGMTVAGYNIASALVSGSNANSFSVTSKYAGGAAAVSIGSLAASSTSKTAPDGTKIANVAINDPGSNGYDFTGMGAAASIAQGMSSQRANEIDEFTTDAVRNNLLGLPLDLASLNMTRGRDTQLPTLNQFRAQNANALKPYASWVAFVANLRYPESAANFIAAYGTHPSLKSVNVGTVLSSATNGTVVTYTLSSTTGIVAGDTVTISGLPSGNVVNGVVDSGVTPTTFTISTKRPHDQLAASSFATADAALARTYRDNAPVSLVAGDITGVVGGTTGTISRVPTISEVRELARDLVAKGMNTNITGATVNSSTSISYDSANNYTAGQTVAITSTITSGTATNCFNTSGLVTVASPSSFTITPASAVSNCAPYSLSGSSSYVSGGSGLAKAEALAFMNSTSAWAGVETGLNYVDLWTGGLAENPGKQPITPPVFGPTFQLVFGDQALNLQNGDRFYYLGRLAGTNLGEEIPAQKFTDIVRRNTPSASDTQAVTGATGILGMNSPGFSVSDCAFTDAPVNSATNSIPNMRIPTASACGTGTMSSINNLWTHTGLDNVTGFGDPNSTAGTKLAGGAGDDGIFGTAGNDILSGGTSGGDLIDGYSGDDIIIGGMGEDLLKGGSGNDSINAGDSAIGDTVDGGSGNDFMHTGQSIYATASMIGESGNDFIQASNSADIAIFGSEGNDWLEGLKDIDIMFGDSGLAGLLSIIKGGDDVINGGAGNDLLAGDGGNDIFQLGDGNDIADGGYGFDWATYPANKRYDNGAGYGAPGIFEDLGGLNPNPSNLAGDALVEVEGISGSSGNDVVFGSQGENAVITGAGGGTGADGVKGQTWVTIPGVTETRVIPGMTAVGPGIGDHATVVAAAQVTNAANGNTDTQIDLSVENTSTFTNGTITFALWPLDNPGTIAGLTGMLNGTPGWNPANGGSWTNGHILLGGAGSDLLGVNAGENVIDGDQTLQTCIKANNGTPFVTGADVPSCGVVGVPGYSTMTLLSPYLDDGTLKSTDLTVVREIVIPTTPVGAAYIDTISLPGAANQYTFAAIAAGSLPVGATSGYRITGTGVGAAATNVDTVYNVEQVVFGGVTPAFDPLTGTYAGAIPLNDNSLRTLTVSGAGLVLSPAFNGGITNYQLTLPAPGTATNRTFTATVSPTAPAGTSLTIAVNAGAATALTSGTGQLVPLVGPGTVVRITVIPPTTIPAVANTVYTVTAVLAGTAPSLGASAPTQVGFTSVVSNYSALYTYALRVTSTNPAAAINWTGPAAGLPLTRAFSVTGLAPGESATATVTATRLNYSTTTATVSGTASQGTFATTPDPTILGQLLVGSRLTVDPGTWGPATGTTFTYAWKCTAFGSTSTISTASSLLLVDAFAGCVISLEVTGNKAGYASVTRTSAANPTVVLGKFTSAPVPTIIGSPTLGNYLTVVDGVWPPNVTFLHQWLRNGSVVHVGPTYTIATADLGAGIQVRTTVSKPNYISETAVSAELVIGIPTKPVLTKATLPKVKSTATMTKGKTITVTLKPGSKNTQGLRTTVTASGGACTAKAIKKSVIGYVGMQITGYKVKLTKKGTCVVKVSVAGSSSYKAASSRTSIKVK